MTSVDSARPSDGRARPAGLHRRAGWGIFDQALFSGSSFALAVSVARDAGASQFGEFGVAYVVYVVLLGAVQGLTAEVLAVKAARTDAVERVTMAAEAAGVALLAGVPCLIVGLGVLATGGSAIGATILIAAPALFVQNVWRYTLFAAGRPRAACANDGLWVLLLCAGLLADLDLGDPATSHVVVWCGAGSLCALVGCRQAQALPRPGACRRWARAHGGSGARYAGEFVALYGSAQLVLISVGAFVGLAASGGYRGVQILFGPLQVAMNAIRLAVMPLLGRRPDGSLPNPIRIGAAYGLAGVASCVAWGGVALIAPDRVGHALLGASWSRTQELIPFAIWVQSATALSLGALLVLRATEALQVTFAIRLAGALVVLALGVTGAAISGPRLAMCGVAIAITGTTAASWYAARSAVRSP